MAWLDGQQIKRLIDGATYLFSNDDEDGPITDKRPAGRMRKFWSGSRSG